MTKATTSSMKTEQKRIVALVEELLHQTRTLGARLLDSTLNHLPVA